MSLSASQIKSQITAANFIRSTDDNLFTLTLKHDGKDKKYTINIDANNRVVSATRIELGTSTWDKLKTALANFFGTSNNVRIVKEMNNLSNNEIGSIKKSAIERHNKNELERQHNMDVDTKIRNFVFKADTYKENFDPLNNPQDMKDAENIYSTATTEKKWPDLSDMILARSNDVGLLGSAIRFGDKDFYDKMFTMVNIAQDAQDSKLLGNINDVLNISPRNLSMLAKYIHENFETNKENIKNFCIKISIQARSNLTEAGSGQSFGGFGSKVSSKYD
ncbi:hypothetical protein [Aeromonas jandaei]|uniref:hypothetical protein n=1 Tax=Aeromonas jandaei TaxID=650 RepID=UPI001116D083|nr:hypothetical protein [Aeromonas jandaei]TNH99671.1 hypothetical protein CF104_15070 [Aeromonas jandaei]